MKKVIQDWLTDVEQVAKIGRWEVDVLNGTSHLTQGVLNIFELTEDEVPPFDKHELFYQERFRPKIAEVFEKLITEGIEGEFEAKITAKSGKEKWVHVIARNLDESIPATRIFGTVQDITETKKTEEERNLLINNTNEVVLIVDRDFRIITFNEKFKNQIKKYYGVSIQKGDSIEDYAFIGDVEEAKALYSRILNGKTEEKELAIKHPGEDLTRYFLSTYKPVYDQNGEITGVFLTNSEITDQKKAEKKLFESEQRFRSLVENGGDGVAIFDDKMQLTYISPAIERILGYSVEEILSLDMFDLIHPNDAIHVQKVIEGALQKPGVTIPGHVSRMKHKDGSWRWVDAVVTNLLNDPAVRGIVDNFKDVTLQYEAELELEKLNKKLIKHLDNSPLGVVEYDKDLFITKWSKKCEEIFGWTEKEIIEKRTNAFDLIHKDDSPKVREVADELREVEVEGNISYNRNHTKNGKIIDCIWYNSVITDEEGKVSTIMSLVQDISQQVKIEQEREQSIKEKSILLAEIHHRVKNNLAVVSGLMQLQVFNSPDKQTSEVLLDSMSRIKSIALVHEQLYTSNDFRNIRFDEQIEKLVVGIEEIMNSNERIAIDFNLNPIILNINQAVPCALFVNEAVTNVFKHAYNTSEQGKMTISCTQIENRVCIKIIDEGVGFSASDESGNTSSLGLTLLEMVTKQLDGELIIERAKPNGTIVELVFLYDDQLSGSSGKVLNY